jgi:hypothetical protein
MTSGEDFDGLSEPLQIGSHGITRYLIKECNCESGTEMLQDLVEKFLRNGGRIAFESEERSLKESAMNRLQNLQCK